MRAPRNEQLEEEIVRLLAGADGLEPRNLAGQLKITVGAVIIALGDLIDEGRVERRTAQRGSILITRYFTTER